MYTDSEVKVKVKLFFNVCIGFVVDVDTSAVLQLMLMGAVPEHVVGLHSVHCDVISCQLVEPAALPMRVCTSIRLPMFLV